MSVRGLSASLSVCISVRVRTCESEVEFSNALGMAIVRGGGELKDLDEETLNRAIGVGMTTTSDWPWKLEFKR